MKPDFRALIQIKACKPCLTAHQYKTLRGQAIAGDSDGALKGLKTILKRGEQYGNGGCKGK
jgi:hypothetical protein